MSSIRNNALVNEDIILNVQFTLNGENVDAFSVNKVEIYPSLYNAQNNTNAIQVIDSSSIRKIGIGKYEYTVSPISVSGWYYDKIYITPKENYAEISFILDFFVKKEDFNLEIGDIPPADVIEPVSVYLYAKNIEGSAENLKGKVRLSKSNVRYKQNIILKDNPVNFSFDEVNQKYYVNLLDTDNMPPDVYYIFDINDSLYKRKVPAKPSISFWDLEEV